MDNVKKSAKRENEKGAALVTVLMISAILLAASAGLMLEVSMNSANVTDAVAEEQAFYAAESGIQSTLNVLRGNVVPNPLIDSTKSATDPVNLMDFRKARTLDTSNAPGDTTAYARLSRWLPYSNAYPDRVVIGDTVGSSTYTPRNGIAYKIQLIEPDEIDVISFTTSVKIGNGTDSVTFLGQNGAGTGINQGTGKITFTGRSYSNEDVENGKVLNLGDFTTSLIGQSAYLAEDTPFVITLNMTKPYAYRTTIRGKIDKGTLTQTSTTSGASPLRLTFVTNQFLLSGGRVTLQEGAVVGINPPSTTGGKKDLLADVMGPEPQRLLLKSTGYGPRGASKVLEAIVQKNFFNGMPAPATLTLVGPSGGFSFDPGNSTNTTYSGDDVVSNLIIPPIGTTNDANLATVNTELDSHPPNPFNGKVIGVPTNVSSEMPEWLNSTTNLDAVIKNLKRVAEASGPIYSSGASFNNNYGNYAEGTGITFVNGDASIRGDGGGILVVTGKLTMLGNVNFKGLIIVTGKDGVDRNGAGTGTVTGNMVVAPYDPTKLSDGFLPPKYDLSGGGNSTMVYNSSALTNGMRAISNFALGVVEK